MNANITTAIINRVMRLSESEKDFGRYEIPNSIYAVLAYAASTGNEHLTVFTESEASEDALSDSAERYYDVAVICATNNWSVCIPLPLLTPAAKVQSLAIQLDRQRHDRRTTEATPAEVAENAAEWEAIVAKIGADFVQDARIWALDEATTSGYAVQPFHVGLDTDEDYSHLLRGATLYESVAQAVAQNHFCGLRPTLVWVERHENGVIVQAEAHTPAGTLQVLRRTMEKWASDATLATGWRGTAEEAFVFGTAQQSAAALCYMLNERARSVEFCEMCGLFTQAMRARKRAAEFGSFFGGDADEAFWEVFQDTSYYPKEVMGE